MRTKFYTKNGTFPVETQGFLAPGAQIILATPSPFPPLTSRPLKPSKGSGERCKLSSEVWGKAPAANNFGAF